jgi:hypothetical protein
MTDKKTTEILKHTFDELEKILESEQEEKGSAHQPAHKEEVISKKARAGEAELTSMDE